MIVYFDKKGNIIQMENDLKEPLFPFNMTLEEKKEYYLKEKGLEFVSFEEEMNIEVFDYKIIKENEEYKLFKI